MFLLLDPFLPGRATRRAQAMFLRMSPPVPVPKLVRWTRRPLARTNPRLDVVVNRQLRLRLLDRQRLAPRV